MLASVYRLKKKNSYQLNRKRIKIALSLTQTFIILYTSILIYTNLATKDIQLSWIENLVYKLLQGISSMLDIICLVTLIDGEEWDTNYISQV